MRPFVANLTASTLLIHALLGCCRQSAFAHWHETAADRSKCAVCCGCRGDTTKESERLPAAPGRGQPECAGVCTYLPAEKSQIDAPQIVVPFHLAAIESELSDGDAASTSFRKGVGDGPNSHAAVRLHLAHQVLLI